MVSKMMLSKSAIEIAASATSDEEIVERVKRETALFEASDASA